MGVYIGGFGDGKFISDSGSVCKLYFLSSLSKQGCFIFRNCLAQAIWVRWIVGDGVGSAREEGGSQGLQCTPTQAQRVLVISHGASPSSLCSETFLSSQRPKGCLWTATCLHFISQSFRRWVQAGKALAFDVCLCHYSVNTETFFYLVTQQSHQYVFCHKQKS